MEKGTSKDVARVFRMIDAYEKDNISKFCSLCSMREFREFDNAEMALMTCDSGDYSGEVIDVLKDYSGYNYRRINASARGRWNYEKHGHSKERERFDKIATELREVLDNNQRSVGNIKVFRGVPLSYFSEYGIESLEDMKSLEGGFLLDKGFVSTSLLDKSCYYRMPNDLGLNYNVKIEYLIPEEFEDGISLGNATYCPNQNEYLINAWNIASVVDVSMDGDDGCIVRAMMIPKHVYDKAYRHEAGNRK